jgi:hypothetical protein
MSEQPQGIALRIGAELSGSALSFDGTRLQFVAPKAFPPGQPLQLTLLRDGAEPLSLSVRSVGSKRRDDGLFHVQARMISLSRETREALIRAFEK